MESSSSRGTKRAAPSSPVAPPEPTQRRRMVVEEGFQSPLIMRPTQDDVNYISLKDRNLAQWIAKNLDSRPKSVGLASVIQSRDAIPCYNLNQIRQEGKEFSEEDIDALLDLLNMTPEFSLEDLFSEEQSRWTCVGTLFSQVVDAVHKAVTEQVPFDRSLLKMAGGMSVYWKCKSWLLVDSVYGIELVRESHWVAYQYDLPRRVINVYDPLRRRGVVDENRDRVFRMHAAVAPIFYNFNYTLEEDKLDEGQPWEVVVKDSPQAANAKDSGVVSVKVIQCLAWDDDFTKLRPNKFSDYRKKMAVDLVKWRKNGSPGYVEMEL